MTHLAPSPPTTPRVTQAPRVGSAQKNAAWTRSNKPKPKKNRGRATSFRPSHAREKFRNNLRRCRWERFAGTLRTRGQAAGRSDPTLEGASAGVMASQPARVQRIGPGKRDLPLSHNPGADPNVVTHSGV